MAEAPMHELRSEVVIDWIERTFPGKPITYVIATHHHTDHSAGLRAYVARGAAAVVHEDAKVLLGDLEEAACGVERLLELTLAQHRAAPKYDRSIALVFERHARLVRRGGEDV